MSAITSKHAAPAGTKMKSRSIPAPLFKYVTTQRALQVLKDKTIRFTQPKFFNDPFEFFPTLDMPKVKAGYLQQKHVRERLQFGEERRAVLRGLPDFAHGIASIFVRDLRTICALCLSERCDIPLQWSHYADQHRGVAIGFRIDDTFLRHPCNRQTPSQYCDFGPIEYRTRRLRFPGDVKDPLHHMFVKDKCWSYEKEWRVVKSCLFLRLTGNEVYVNDFEPSAIRCVIRGLFTCG